MKTLLYFVAMALAGCGGINLETESYPTTPPKPAELAGEYHPTPETLALVKNEGGYPSREMSVVLAPDGTFHMTNIPDWWRTDFGKPAGGFDSRDGKWEVVPHQTWYSLNITTSAGVSELNIIGREPPYEIGFTIGDPDSGRVMLFKRDSPRAPKS